MEAQGRLPHERTLFHLIPYNDKARPVLGHGENHKFVSYYSPTDDHAALGLEVGYHNSQRISADHIATLGREGDLIIEDKAVSRKHLTFEVLGGQNVPAICLRVQRPSTEESDVGVILPTDNGEEMGDLVAPVTEALVIDYPKNYILDIVGYRFMVGWCLPAIDDVRAKIKRQHALALQEARNYDPRNDRETLRPTTGQRHYITRHRSRAALPVQENAASRFELDRGTFGRVYQSVDNASGRLLAMKLIRLSTSGREDERARVNAELKILGDCEHAHIIEYLGSSDVMHDEIHCYMPLRSGNLFGLAKNRRLVVPLLYEQVLCQMLSALDYLEQKRLCHRDLKPNNILFDVVDKERGLYHFQLGDFGSASYINSPRVMCGTPIYWAPEIPKGDDQGFAVDIWALYVSLVHVQQGSAWPGPAGTTAAQVHALVRNNDYIPKLRQMAREDPRLRPSAAQCLIEWFGGQGLAQPASRVKPLLVVDGELPPPRQSKLLGPLPPDMPPATAGPSAAGGRAHKHPGAVPQDLGKGKQPLRRVAAAGVANRKRKQPNQRFPSPMHSIIWGLPSAMRNEQQVQPSAARSNKDLVMCGTEDLYHTSVGGHNLRPRR